MTLLTSVRALAGGALIGLAASLLLIESGRIAGVSGIAGNLLLGKSGDRAWRAAFLLGLVGVGFIVARLAPDAIVESPRSLGLVAVAGLLVGVGTQVGNGCTSGHAVCGLSRLSPRSLAATLTFMVTGVLAATVLRWLGGGV